VAPVVFLLRPRALFGPNALAEPEPSSSFALKLARRFELMRQARGAHRRSGWPEQGGCAFPSEPEAADAVLGASAHGVSSVSLALATAGMIKAAVDRQRQSFPIPGQMVILGREHGNSRFGLPAVWANPT